MLDKLKLYTDTIFNWIVSSKSSDNLDVCRSAIDECIFNKFNNQVPPDELIAATSFLHSAANEVEEVIMLGNIPESLFSFSL